MLKAIYALPIALTTVLSPSVKTTIITMSSSLSIIGIASGILSQKPGLIGCSVLFGVTNYIAWLDLGASETIKGYKEGFREGVTKEKGESVLIKTLIEDLGETKLNRESLQAEAAEMLKMNRALKDDLIKSQEDITSLKIMESESLSLIKNLKSKLSIQELKIEELVQSEIHLKTQIESSAKSIEATAAVINALMATITDQDRIIKNSARL